MKPFVPELCEVFTSTRVHLVPRESDEYIVWYRSALRTDDPDEDSDEPEIPVAKAEWAIIGFEPATNDEQDLFFICDAHSQELCDVYETLVDPETEEFRYFESWGNVVYFQRIEVEPDYDVQRVAGELIDHILRFHGWGCGAAFIFGVNDPPEVRDAFKQRGFSAVKGVRGMEFFVLDLVRVRPPLPPAEEALPNVKRLAPRHPAGK
jgi:hypothetical protein